MILIDQHAETTLSARLEKMKEEAASARGIYLKQVRISGDSFVKTVAKHITGSQSQLYVCEDGEIFILAPTLASKEAKAIVLDIAEQINMPVSEEWARFFEIPLHIHELLSELDAKQKKKHAAELLKQQSLENAQAQRGRQAILNSTLDARQEDIAQRRQAHKVLEMMMIEDDAFSRRLLENVLEKKYKLTGLGEATHALDTYIRIAPDILFLDINLPDVTGHELLERIIAIDPQAYVIMLSGNSDRENILTAMNKGAKGFIAKPFNREKLFQYIERCPTIHRLDT